MLEQVKEAVEELNADELPEGVQIVPFYDRSIWSTSTLHTVAHSVLWASRSSCWCCCCSWAGRRWRLLVALTIPFSLLFALVLMYFVDIPIGLLSIGAIDFGIIVDGAVIMADNIAHRLGDGAARRAPTRTCRKAILAAALEVRAAGLLLDADDHRRLSAAADADAASKDCCSGRWR